jgi:hypothetical protein
LRAMNSFDPPPRIAAGAAGHATGDCLMKLIRLADTFDSMIEKRPGAEPGFEGGCPLPRQIGWMPLGDPFKYQAGETLVDC